MAVEVVASPPFGGKGRYARAEVARREAAGELGLIVLDWSLLYRALFPGEQSALRDDATADTGAPRAAGAAFDFMVGAIVARELSGFVLSQSPRRAVEIAERLNAPIVEVEADVGDVATRAESHMRTIGRTVTRAAAGALRSQCRTSGRHLLPRTGSVSRTGSRGAAFRPGLQGRPATEAAV